LPYLGNFIQWLGRALHMRPPNVANAESLVEVDWINGAFLMVKKSAIEVAGVMDEDFFLYAEEAEWCYRLKKTGRLCLFGEIKVIHLQGETANTIYESTGKGYYNLYNKKGLQIMLSNFVRIRKQFGLGWFLFNLFVYTVDIPIFFIGALLTQFLNKKKRFYSIDDVILFCKNMLVIYRMSFSIISKKTRFYRP
jgi:GT2 family glycosyltransferase